MKIRTATIENEMYELRYEPGFKRPFRWFFNDEFLGWDGRTEQEALNILRRHVAGMADVVKIDDTAAEAFARRFFSMPDGENRFDGQCFESPDGASWTDALRDECGVPDSRHGGNCDEPQRYGFADGSSVIVAGEGWDFGFGGSSCWCWSSNGSHDDDCPEVLAMQRGHAVCERLDELGYEHMSRVMDDGRVAVHNSAAGGWCAVDVADAEDLVDRLEEDDSDSLEIYDEWFQSIYVERVEVDE